MVSLGQKLKIPKTFKKTIRDEDYSCSIEKMAGKNIKYWRNETMLKMGYVANEENESRSRHNVEGSFLWVYYISGCQTSLLQVQL